MSSNKRSNKLCKFCFQMETYSNTYFVKSVRSRSFPGPYFPAFGLNTQRYGVSPRIQSKCRKIRTRKTPNADTFHAVTWLSFFHMPKLLLGLNSEMIVFIAATELWEFVTAVKRCSNYA